MAHLNEEQLKKTIIACLDEMYRSSEPPITWEEVEESYYGAEEWYMNHRISLQKYDDIRRKYEKLIPEHQHRYLHFELLNYAPAFKRKKDDRRSEEEDNGEVRLG